jgi:epoxyqueuosine reductase
MTETELAQLADKLRRWGKELGFQQVGITDTQLDLAEERLAEWLAYNRHGDMHWMADHGKMRSRPGLLEPGTLRVISVRMDYFSDTDAWNNLRHSERAYISRYALGRDYHKLMRRRLARLADQLRAEAKESNLGRALVDSAPVMEKPLAEKAGLGWQGKHTLILNRQAGSFFFLGEIYTDIALPIDSPATDHCGTCTACLDACPTGAIIAPYQLDARRCITYLTIENKGSIDPALRPLMGNRVFGCDDCQLVCPFNKFVQPTGNEDFKPRHGLDQAELVELFLWDKATWLERTAGSAIRRAGYEGWLRNIAIGLGNGPATPAALTALKQRLGFSNLVDEHILWALDQLQKKQDSTCRD